MLGAYLFSEGKMEEDPPCILWIGSFCCL